MNYSWDWAVFFRPTIDHASLYVWWILSGFGLTILIGLVASVIALAIGGSLGVATTLPSKTVRALVSSYVELFRNIPLLVQLFLWYYIAPVILLPVPWQNAINEAHPVLVQTVTAMVCLGLFTAARVCIQVRAGIEAQPRGQFYAGYAMGLTRMQTYRYVILPMAFRVVVPPLTSEFLNVFKNSAVALTIGLLELTARARQMGEFTSHIFEAFIVATALYFMVTQLVEYSMRKLEGRLVIPGQDGGNAS